MLGKDYPNGCSTLPPAGTPTTGVVLIPLFSHILPYGEVRLNMARRLALNGHSPAADLVGAEDPLLVGWCQLR